MARIKSRLKETAFSRINLRDAYITEYPEYAAALRDEALFSNYGIKALVKVPKFENNVDEYSNFVDDDFKITTESVVPKFEQYRQNVSENGMSADGTEGLYPLEVIIPTKLHLPKNSRIVLTEYSSKEYILAREWTVLSTEMKQLSGSKTYTRIAYCVPSRQSIHRTMEFEEQYGMLYFNIHNVTDKMRHSDIRANCTFYFDINPTKLVKGMAIEIDEIIDISHEGDSYQENIHQRIEPEIQETITDTYENTVKTLFVKNDKIASFVVKPTSISVLY